MDFITRLGVIEITRGRASIPDVAIPSPLSQGPSLLGEAGEAQGPDGAARNSGHLPHTAIYTEID